MMSSNIRHAPLTDGKQRLPAPRVMVRQAEGGQAIEPVSGNAADQDGFRAQFLAAFGTPELAVAEALYQQVLTSLCPGQKLDTGTANLALALMHEIGPKDVVEAMLATQMIVGHVAALDANRRALHVEQTPGGRQAYLSLARKLMMLSTAQMGAMGRHRGKGTTQKIIIERVVVARGGKAIVGAVSSGRGDGE